MTTIVILIILAVIIGFLIAVYNSLIRLRNQVMSSSNAAMT